MKNAFAVIMVALLVISAHAQNLQEAKVPSAVRNSFKKTFSGASDVKWSKEGAAEYEAEFKVGTAKKSASFDGDGKWINTETEISAGELPAAVKASVEKEFAGGKIKEAELYEAPGQDKSYELALVKGKTKMEFLVAADGKVLKREDQKEEKKDKKKD